MLASASPLGGECFSGNFGEVFWSSRAWEKCSRSFVWVMDHVGGMSLGKKFDDMCLLDMLEVAHPQQARHKSCLA